MTPRRAAHSLTGRPALMAMPPRRVLVSMLATVLALMVGVAILWTPVRAHSASAGLLVVGPGQGRTMEVAGSAQDAFASARFEVPGERTIWMALQFRADRPGHRLPDAGARASQR